MTCKKCKEKKTKIKELEASFELRWKADMKAIKMWQKATGRKMVWPDHTDMVVWLLHRVEKGHSLPMR